MLEVSAVTDLKYSERNRKLLQMGGKKKGKGKGKKKKDAPEPDDEFKEMKGEQLEITIQNLREKLTNGKMQRNTLQIEKDMIHDFYQNTREEIKELEAQIKNFDT